jgi:OHCU decarboxylase
VTLAELNRLSPDDCVQALAGIAEHAPWVGAAVTAERPFADPQAVADHCELVIRSASDTLRYELIANHPDLGGKAAIAGDLTTESASEQASAGLDRLTPEEFAEFHHLNAEYRARFGFGFIICVREQTKGSILSAFRSRVTGDRATELATALDEVIKIVRLRANDLVVG